MGVSYDFLLLLCVQAFSSLTKKTTHSIYLYFQENEKLLYIKKKQATIMPDKRNQEGKECSIKNTNLINRIEDVL